MEKPPRKRASSKGLTSQPRSAIKQAQKSIPAEWRKQADKQYNFFPSRSRHTICSRDWSSDVCSSDLGGFPGGRIRNVNNVGFVRRNRDSHRPRTAAPNPMIRVDEPPGFAGVIRNVHAAIFVGFHRGINTARLDRRHGDGDAAQSFIRAGQAFRQRTPVPSPIGRFENAAACGNKRRAAANLPGRDPSGPQGRVNCPWVRRIKRQIGCARVFALIQNFLERLTSIGRAKNSSLGVRAVRMPQGRNKKAVRILRIDKNRGDLPCIAQPKVRPSFSRVSGFIDTVAGRQVRPLQTFPAADVNDIRVGRCHGQRPHRTGRLVVKNRIPGIPEVSGFPDATVDGRHVKNARLSCHARDCYGAATAKRPDAAPAHLAKQLLVEGWLGLQIGRWERVVGMARKRRSKESPAKDESDQCSPKEPISRCKPPTEATHPAPPRNRRAYSAEQTGANLREHLTSRGCRKGAAWLKRLRAQPPLSNCALFQLCRKVFKASRLNLGGRLRPPFFLCKMFLKSCLWKGVHDCAKVWRASKALPDGGLRL